MFQDPLVAEAVHDTGVRRLHAAYADTVNRRAWPELEGLFVDGAPVVIDRREGDPVRLVGGAAVGEFISAAVSTFDFFEFVVLNAHVVFPRGAQSGDASGRLFMCEIRQQRGSGRRTNAFGLYHDRYRFDGRRWRYAERAYHSLARDGRDLDVFPIPGPPDLGRQDGQDGDVPDG